MKLRAIDQVHVSAVKADTIRPGEVFDVSDSQGEALLKARPGAFEHVDEAPAPPAPPAPKRQAAPRGGRKAPVR